MWICIHRKYIFTGICLIFLIISLLCYTSMAHFDEDYVDNTKRIITDDVEKKFRNIYKTNEKIAYLTFDDGPSKYTTRKVLEVLEKYDIKATFFVLRKMR